MLGCGAQASTTTSTATTTARPAAASAPAPPPDRFDAKRAVRLMQLQVDYGQRPAGSPQLRALAKKLRLLLPGGHFEAIPGEPKLRNVVGSLPGRAPAIVLGAHYDTLVKPKGFVGANNGASGTAIVIGVARALRKLHRPAGAPALRFVLFDGEEPAQGLPEEHSDFYDTGLRGSRAYVKRHGATTRAMVLLDYVANRGLQLPREGTSTESLWAQVRAAAKRTRVLAYFPDTTGTAIIDDHSPFLRAGLPAVDLIDWSYDGHTLHDSMKRISTAATDAVGETMVELLRSLR